MKIFVPRFQWDSAQQDRERLINMFGELIAPNAEQNLERIVREWNEADHQKGYKVIKAMYRRSASKILGPGVVEKHTLEPYLRREHVTAHGGAKPGADHCRDHDRQVAMEIGAGIAELGFNLWYGGGEDGRMGDYLNGFLQQIQRHRYPDQYSVQVSPASFALPKEFKSVNGATAANEGLSPHSDIALVIPKFVNRRDFLDSVCIAAITGVGGVGSCDELLDILVHKKTGQTDTLSYVLNEYRPRAGINFWDPIMEQLALCVEEGYEKPSTLTQIKPFSSAKEILACLKEDTDAKGLNPHKMYEEYCRAHNVKNNEAGRPAAHPAAAPAIPALTPGQHT